MFVLLQSLLASPSRTQVFLSQFREHRVGASVNDESPYVDLDYYSRWNLSRIPVHSGDHLVGDHVVLAATWYPESLISQTEIVVTALALQHSISAQNNSPSVSIDTHALNNNASCVITLRAHLTNGSVVSQVVRDVYIGNFFVPSVTVLAPNGGEIWSGVNNITWVAHDWNLDEALSYEVLISSDSGVTFQVLASNLSRTWFEWNCSSFFRRTTYIVEVRVSDGIYIASDRSDGLFTAGDVIGNQTEPWNIDRIVLFLVIVISIGITMGTIVYIAAKRWLLNTPPSTDHLSQ